MNIRVTPPLNDDIRVTVDEYRNKLYEIMSTHHNIKPTRSFLPRTSIKYQPEIKQRQHKEPDRYSRVQKPLSTQSEPKMTYMEPKTRTNIQTKSDSKIIRRTDLLHSESNMLKSSGDYKKHAQSSCDFTMHERVRKKSLNGRSNLYMQSFNSYNPSHGIITQSALMELRSSGLR